MAFLTSRRGSQASAGRGKARTPPPLLATLFHLAMAQHSVFRIPTFFTRACDDMQAAAMLQKVCSRIDDVFKGFKNRALDSVPFEETYRCAYDLTTHKRGEVLYDALKDRFRAHASTFRSRDHFSTAAAVTSDLCKYLDRTWVMREKRTPVQELAMEIYDAPSSQRARKLSRLRRHASVVGHCACVLNVLYTEVTFRPQHSGAKRSREEFEAAVQQQQEEEGNKRPST